MDLDELIARESIRDLVARYNSNGDTGRFEQVVELFTPDAVMDVDGDLYEGHEAIRGMFTGVSDRWVGPATAKATATTRYIRHMTTTLQIDVLGPTTATSRCYYQVLTQDGLDHWGRYLDEYGVAGGRWLFTRRREILDGFVPGGWAASMTGAE